MNRDTLLNFFDDFADLNDQFIVYDDGLRTHSRTYRETAQAARTLANRMSEAGVAKGDRVLIWSENRPEWIAAFWGCMLIGAAAVPADYRASASFVLRIADKVAARLVLIGDEVVWPDDREPVPWRMDRVVDWDATTRGEPPAVQVNSNDLVEIIFTSGATADPKGVLITHRNILANIVPIENEVHKYRRWGKPFFPLRFLNLLPLSHMFGQAMATFIPPMLPGVTVFMRGYSPDEIVRQIHQRRVSVMVSVPKMLEILREHVTRLFPEINAASPRGSWPRRWWRYRRVHRLLGWKFWAFIVGAAPLAPEVEEFWSRLGYLVIQGYGLTETAPIVTLNHPFHARRGTVGTPIGGVEMKLAPDHEILVRGDNVSSGYFGETGEAPRTEGWLHTGDIGEIDSEGRLTVRGRKKEMIVTPEGLNVFPEDVEHVLLSIPGVKDAAVVGQDRVHAVLILQPTAVTGEIVRSANLQLEDHQRIQSVSIWPHAQMPRTDGTGKLKRQEIAKWVVSGGAAEVGATARPPEENKLYQLLSRYARGRTLSPETTFEELGLSSLERVELMAEAGISESRFQEARTLADLAAEPPVGHPVSVAPVEPEFLRWTRSPVARLIRDVSLASFILPLGRVFVWLRVEGRQNLEGIRPPVIFAANHQSIFDVPAILMALPYRWRTRVAPAAAREWFAAHFHPDRFPLYKRIGISLNYYLAALFFNCFTLPQREAGAIGTLRYAGELASDGWCVAIFPEGVRTETGEIRKFQPGVGMMASRLKVPVIPVRLEGLDRILGQGWHMARPGHARVTFGPPMHLEGDDYAALAQQVESAVKSL
jgi:long-chain acyl-CoA synthetase